MIEVMPVPVRETNELGEWINQGRLKATSERFLKSLSGLVVNMNLVAQSITVTAGEFSRTEWLSGRRAHIRAKALRRESRRCRYRKITLELTGIL